MITSYWKYKVVDGCVSEQGQYLFLQCSLLYSILSTYYKDLPGFFLCSFWPNTIGLRFATPCLDKQNKMVLFRQLGLAMALLRGVASQTQYGGNSVRVVPDPAVVESRAFPAPNATIYSPAFALNALFLDGWTEGTAGATSEFTLRKSADLVEMTML